MGNRIARASAERIERLRLGLSLQEVSTATGISMTALSAAERGLRELSAEQEARRRGALERLAAEKVVVCS